MYKFVFLLMGIAMPFFMNSQGITNFDIELEEITIPNMPGLQSFAWAKTSTGKWLIVCGRTDGLHDHRPPFSFPASLANDDIWVIDPISKQVWSSPINSLSTDLKNALTATNVEFEQVGDVLYLVGGYGVNLSSNQHETFDHITAIDVDDLADAVINNQSIANYFRQISDSRFQVTGGYLHRIGDVFYLIGGQNFEGRYNPHNGPSFTQTYAESIKKFKIVDNGTSIQITNYSETTDAVNLRRRDYNLSPQIFPNGDTGLTVFTGVFQDVIDIPFFNTVDVTGSGYSVRNNFAQLLNQYHTAHAPFFDNLNNTMHTVFFGGIGMYYYDALGVLKSDSAVPFVQTISRITRFANDSMVEIAMPQPMPGYLGASAEFIPSDSVSLYSQSIINLNAATSKTLVGYVVGGIESTTPNVFMFSGGTSSSSSRVFKVYIEAASIGVEEAVKEPFGFEIYPNPTNDFVKLYVDELNVQVQLFNDIGEKLDAFIAKRGEQEIDLSGRAAGVYYINLSLGDYSRISTVVKK